MRSDIGTKTLLFAGTLVACGPDAGSSDAVGTAGNANQGLAGSGAVATGGVAGSGTGGSVASGGSGGTQVESMAGMGGAADPGGSLTISPARGVWTAVRHYSGATPPNRTNGPEAGPEQAFTIHNGGAEATEISLTLSGPGAANFELLAPAQSPTLLDAGADLTVNLRLDTSDAALGPAPAQDDGATVVEASLEVSSANAQLSVRNYALVLTYVELEPTFGQILDAFVDWDAQLPAWLRNDANPNPGSPLPGVEPNTDEISENLFERVDPAQPVTLEPIARFSPPGVVPFGWYPSGSVQARSVTGELAEQADPQTNDKSRMLSPPLISGSVDFEPDAEVFGIWMMPEGVGLLTSEDASTFDGQHRVRIWTLRDSTGQVIPHSFLIGGEEAANGDYQDYVFVIGNVKPSP